MLLRSIGAHLGRLGYSAVEFQEAFTQTINYLRGSPFSNSAVGPDARVDARHSTSVTVGRLTDELSALGGWLQENDGDEARAAVRELDGLTAEVVLDRPAVHSRWATVRTRAAAVLGTGANITQITDLVMTLFGP
ncbi:hypothetical protein [Pseudonocardia alni]|uniref:Uncharacterized protein n=1 Tax=Pseudonocardia alni subsp. carboxydivorans TaxID=415010 RepID=A0ABU9ALK4_PSEA5